MRLRYPIILLALLAALSILVYSGWLVYTGQNSFALIIWAVALMVVVFLPRR